MRNIKLTIQFDGTAYHGWQIQKGDTTVQQTIRDTLSTILNTPVTLHGSGRTDAGVHALGQVAHFLTDSAMKTQALVKALNALLPHDIAVKDAEDVAPDFHARFSATERVYWYLIWNTPVRSPFYRRYSWHIIQPLDIAAMKDAAACLVGTHDFTSFQGSDKEEVNPVREVTSIRLRKTRRHIILFEINANAFLKHMVRNTIGTLADVGRGKLTGNEFRRILDGKDRRLAGITAPAQGLFLKHVRY